MEFSQTWSQWGQISKPKFPPFPWGSVQITPWYQFLYKSRLLIARTLAETNLLLKFLVAKFSRNVFIERSICWCNGERIFLGPNRLEFKFHLHQLWFCLSVSCFPHLPISSVSTSQNYWEMILKMTWDIWNYLLLIITVTLHSIEKIKLLLYILAWINLIYITLSKRSHTQKITSHPI